MESQKILLKVSVTNSTPRYIPKRNKNTCPHKNLFIAVVIHNSPQMGITQMSTN